jgi:O-acetylhomoserine (thiol)-lyase
MAAQMTALLTILKTGDHIVAASTLYGGTVGQLGIGFSRLGITTTFVDPEDPENFRRAIRPNTRAVYGETLGNPLVNVFDIEAVAQIAHAHGLPLVIDNTVASPYLCNPFAFGADIVVHSATKYLGGHGTTMAGVVVESGKFDWGSGLAAQNFPEMLEPSKAYHGVKFYETFGDFGYTMKARMEVNRTFGGALSPLNAWLILQGIETLHLRMQAHCRNAHRVAEFLSEHPLVGWVNYPGLASSPHHALAKKQFRAIDGRPGASGILTFGIRAGDAVKAGERFIDACEFLSHLANIGDAKTLVIHPASTTHRQLDEEELARAGVRPDMIRLSVGIEDVEDILWDLDQALRKAVA